MISVTPNYDCWRKRIVGHRAALGLVENDSDLLMTIKRNLHQSVYSQTAVRWHVPGAGGSILVSVCPVWWSSCLMCCREARGKNWVVLLNTEKRHLQNQHRNTQNTLNFYSICKNNCCQKSKRISSLACKHNQNDLIDVWGRNISVLQLWLETFNIFWYEPHAKKPIWGEQHLEWF